MNKIVATSRPWLPHEHPTFRDYFSLFKQNLRYHYQRRRHFVDNTSGLVQLFANQQTNLEEKCCKLSRYFIDSFLYYGQKHHCRIYLPGLPSEQGRESDAIESCARSLPLLATWLHYRQQCHGSFSADDEKIRRYLHDIFLHGTNRKSDGYWGIINDYDQRICECADIALALWLSKNWLWFDYNDEQRKQIIDWLSQLNQRRTVDNNWHLFILLTQVVIRALTGSGEIDTARYLRIKEFYVGDGWFRDGARGNYDYYNSWAFHYSLFWINQIDSNFDYKFIRQACQAFSYTFRYFFTTNGFPFFGRSACYRFAAPSALIAQAIDAGYADGQLTRIITTLYNFFIQRGAIQQGVFTQGLFQANRALLDGYSGTGSSLWSLRPLILMLYGGQQCQFWQQQEAPLEIEKSSFNFIIEPIKAQILGIKETQEVIINFMENQYPDSDIQQGHLIHQGWYKRIQEQLTGRSTRPKNNLIRKGVTTYSSKLNLYL